MFFKSFFSKKKEEVEEIKLSLENLEKWIKEENREFFDETENEIDERYRTLNYRLGELKESFESFKKSSVPTDIFDKLKKAAQTNKVIIENDIEKFIASFKIPQKNDFKTAYEFSNLISQRISNLGKKDGRGFAIISDAMPDDIKNFKKSMSDLEKEVFNFHEFLTDKNQRIKEIEEVIKLSKDITSMRKELQENEKKIKNLMGELNHRRQKTKDVKSEIEELKNSKEMLTLKEMKEKLKGLEEEKSKLENKIVQEISIFKKAFKKMSRHSKKAKIMSRYVSFPLDIAREPNGVKNFKNLLSFVKNAIQKNNSMLSEKIKRKTLAGIRSIESGELDQILKEYKKISSEILQLSEKIKNSNILEKIEMKNDEVERIEREISMIDEKINDLKNENEQMSEKIEFEKESLMIKIKDLSDKNIKIVD